MLKAMKLVKDGGGNMMMPPDTHYSASATRPGVFMELALLVAKDGLSSSASLSFTGQERGGRTGLLKTQASQKPASRNIHVALPASPLSSPRQYNPNPNTVSLYFPSTLKTHMKKTKHGSLK